MNRKAKITAITAVTALSSVLGSMTVGTVVDAFVPAFNKTVKMKIYYLKDQGTYAVWKATKANGQYDLKTFEVKARPVENVEGLRPGMSLILKQ